ncbi:MAG: ABC transporter ATP-binding protein [Lachnospiraceae bacterium]
MSRGELVCNDVSKRYGKKEVLHKINLTLESGKIYGMIGRNGAGKTTLLSIMSAQNPLSEGSVKLDDETVWENKKMLDQICFSRELATGSNAGSGLKVKEFLKVASIYYPNWDAALAAELVEKFELQPKDRINKLSKGMTSMVTIIVALASRAKFTFLDEPVAGLDVIMRELFYKTLLQEFAKNQRTFVISTHIIQEAADLFEEVILIDKGKLMLKENTQNLVERAVRISGREEVVKEAIAGFSQEQCHSFETVGRSKGVTVLLEQGQKLPEGYDVTIQPLNLQNVFVALCGMEE